MTILWSDDRTMSARDERLDPPPQKPTCPCCARRGAKADFVQRVRDAVHDIVGETEAADVLGSHNVYMEEIDAIGDWIGDTVERQTREDGGRICLDCYGPDDRDY